MAITKTGAINRTADDDEDERAAKRGYWTMKVGKDGEVTIPIKLRTIQNINPGDDVAIYPDTGPGVKIEKMDATRWEKFKSWRHWTIALLLVTSLVTIPLSAFAQADCPPDYLWDQTQQACLPPGSIPTPTNDNQTPVTSVPTTSPLPPAGTVLTQELSGRSAYFPLRIVVKYPAGLELKPSALAGSQASVFNLNNYVNTPAPGFVTTEFSTGVADSFTVNIGQRYEFPINQVAIWEVFSNEEKVQSGIIPITTDNFFVTFNFITSPAPHIPTAEELNSGVYERIADVKAEVVKNNDVTGALGDSLQNTSLTLQGFIGIAIILVLILILEMLVLIWHGRVTRSRVGDNNQQYVRHQLTKPAQPPEPALEYSSTMATAVESQQNKKPWFRRR